MLSGVIPNVYKGEAIAGTTLLCKVPTGAIAESFAVLVGDEPADNSKALEKLVEATATRYLNI